MDDKLMYIYIPSYGDKLNNPFYRLTLLVEKFGNYQSKFNKISFLDGVVLKLWVPLQCPLLPFFYQFLLPELGL